ncbi:MAG: MAPEG family protein [Proteobacteria bacterium]|nr:MAPEG family protein [Pseudomonadota bacterium]
MTSLPTELEMLLWSAILYIIQVLLPATAIDAKEGMAFGLSNRDTQPSTSPWVARAERAVRNMQESLLPFACLVLVAHTSGSTGEASAMGATLFFFSRLLYAVLYPAGITVFRSLAWFGGIIGMGMIVYQII